MTRRLAASVGLFCTIALVAAGALGTDRAWLGAVDANWFDPNNWDPIEMPEPADVLSVDGFVFTDLPVLIADGGSVTLLGSGAYAGFGELTVEASGALAVIDAGLSVLTDLRSDGTLEFRGAAVEVGGNVELRGRAVVGGATQLLALGAVDILASPQSESDLTVEGGTRIDADTFGVSEGAVLHAIDSADICARDSITIDGTAVVDGGSTLTVLRDFGPLYVSGSLRIAGASHVNSLQLDMPASGRIDVAGEGTILNANGPAILEYGAVVTLREQSYGWMEDLFSSGAVHVESGSYLGIWCYTDLGGGAELTADGNGTIVWNKSVVIRPAGRVSVTNDANFISETDLLIEGPLDVASGGLVWVKDLFRVEPGGQIRMSGSQTRLVGVELVNQGVITGSGILAAELWNEGILAPAAGPDAMAVDGNFVHAPAGVLAASLNDADTWSRLRLTGAADLAGALELTVPEGFVPAYGQAFPLVEAAGGVTGRFRRVSGHMLDGNMSLAVVYGGTAVRAVAVLPGDINLDGVVDLDDITVLGTFYGRDGLRVWREGDLNGDGRVDLDDLTILGTAYGRTGGAPVPVPEPATAGLLLLGAGGLLRRRSRRA